MLNQWTDYELDEDGLFCSEVNMRRKKNHTLALKVCAFIYDETRILYTNSNHTEHLYD